jgi:hypothetical protein
MQKSDKRKFEKDPQGVEKIVLWILVIVSVVSALAIFTNLLLGT